MTLFLLIIIAVMVLVTMVCSIICTTSIVKENKSFDLVKKVLSVTGIILVIALVIGAAVGVSTIKKENKSSNNKTTESKSVSLEEAGFNEVTLDEYISLVNGSEKSIILVARPTCSYCELFTPILKQAMEEMNLTVNYINTDNFSNDDWTKFNGSLDYLSSEQWGTPLTLIVQNGEAIAENNGYVELDTIKEFFTNNGFGE